MTEALPQGAAKVKAVDDMFDAIAPRYDLLNRMLTFGMDVGWRKKTVASLGLAAGSVVLDLACGTGDLCRELAARGYRPVPVEIGEFEKLEGCVTCLSVRLRETP